MGGSERPAGLAHRGSGSDNDECCGGDAAQDAIEIGETEPQSGRLAVLVDLFEAVEGLGGQVREHRCGLGAVLGVGHCVHGRFGLVDGLCDIGREPVGVLGDLCRGGDEPPQLGGLGDDAGVAVDGLPGDGRGGDRVEHLAVRGHEEVLGAQHLEGGVRSAAGEQHCSQDGFLGVGVARQTPGCGLCGGPGPCRFGGGCCHRANSSVRASWARGWWAPGALLP